MVSLDSLLDGLKSVSVMVEEGIDVRLRYKSC